MGYRVLMPMSVLMLSIVLSSAAVAAIDGIQLPVSVRKMLEEHNLPESSLGVFVQDVTEQDPMLLFNSDIPFNPASAIKLLTTFIGLDVLSPAYRWRTEAYVDGPVVEGRLHGRLIIKGGGDPFLVTEHFWTFLRGIRHQGVQHIAGDLVLDKSAFTVPAADPGAFDGKPYRPYNVMPDALLLNYQVTRFMFRPDDRGGLVDIIADPPQSNLRIENKLTLVPGDCRGYPNRITMHVLNQQDGASVRFSGKYSAKCGVHSLTRAVSRADDYFFGVFKAMWTGLGGTIDGELRVEAVPADARRIHTTFSKPVAELIRGMNKYSNNVMTRQLLLTLGMERYGRPGDAQKGKAVVREWLARHGVSASGLILDNGAGLSRKTRISARTLGDFLVTAYRSPYMAEFVSSLPLAAMDEGLRGRFGGEPLAGRIHMKTGMLDHVRGLGGYMLSRSGRTFVVVALQNHWGIHRGAGTQVQTTLLRWLFER